MNPKIEIYFADVDPLKNNDIFNALYSSLSEERKKKIDRFRFEKDKLLSAGAGALLRKALSDNGINDAEFIIGEKQKPYLKNYPDIFFNLSHSEETVMCVISDCEVGCDIEKIKEKTNNIAERYFTESENNLISSATEKDEMFFRIWTLKESYMKALGLGLTLALNEFSIDINNKEISAIHNGKRADYSFYEFNDIQGYCASCCIKGSYNDLKPKIQLIDLNSLI